MRETPTSTRRSDEMSLVMNAKPWRSRSRNSGVTRMPSTPQTTASPPCTSRSLRQSGPAVLDDDHGVHPLLLDLVPLPLRAARASGGWSSSRSRPARSRPCRRERRGLVVGQTAAERDQLLEDLPEHLLVRPGDPHRDERRLLVAAADIELQHVERRRSASRPCRRPTLRICESIRWPSASTTSLKGHWVQRQT